MLPFRKILFPVDYSEPCQGIVPYVQEIIRHFSADLTLVHAYGPTTVDLSGLSIVDPELLEKAQMLEQQRLREFARETFPGQHVDSIVELGEPGSIIDKVVQHQGTDLVMLSTHGRGPIRRFLLGSVAAKVLHDVSAAVWTSVGSVFTEHTPAIPYKSILCTLDETEEAPAVLKAAATIASSYNAQMTIVHIVEVPISMDIDLSSYKTLMMDAADAKLRDLKRELGVDAPHAVIDARVPEGVQQEALRRNADLIITGRGRAQTAFNTMWSRLYPIVRESPCPVLSI